MVGTGITAVTAVSATNPTTYLRRNAGNNAYEFALSPSLPTRSATIPSRMPTSRPALQLMVRRSIPISDRKVLSQPGTLQQPTSLGVLMQEVSQVQVNFLEAYCRTQFLKHWSGRSSFLLDGNQHRLIQFFVDLGQHDSRLGLGTATPGTIVARPPRKWSWGKWVDPREFSRGHHQTGLFMLQAAETCGS
ncbi:MAG: hypothetical protein WDO15_18210 [Bacteroidota bacterium]